MSDSYGNFGVANTPVGLPSNSYNAFGVTNSNMNGLPTIQNTVTESVSPRALGFGLLTSDIQSANFSTGVSGWRIRANGDAEFQSLTGVNLSGSTISGATITGATITGGTITGGTFKTSNTSTRVELNGTDNALYYYNSGNIQLGINSNGVFLNTLLGVASASIQGFGTNDCIITIAGSSAVYHISTAALYQDSGADLGTNSLPWGTLYYSGALTHVSDIRIKDNVAPLKYGLDDLVKLNPIKYELKGKTYLGFSAQAVSKVIPEITLNCEENSPVGSAKLSETELIPVLVNAIKELKAQVDTLSRQISKSVL